MIDEKVFQKIFDEISGFLPNQWNNVIVYLEYGENSYSFSFYVKQSNSYTKCFDIEGIPEDKLMKAFSRIDGIVSKERGIMLEQAWTNMTMTVDKAGNMKTYFDYTDLSTGSYEYKKAWKEKFLQ